MAIDERTRTDFHVEDTLSPRELARAHVSSLEAQQAHLEIESFREERDDWRALYETPEDRTRAEHAEHLSRTNPDARDLYERGATLYGDTLVIPREAHDSISSSEQIRIGTHTHAVREFTPLVGEQKAKEIAKEFVELGNAIAGRTADGDTRLTVFRTFYREIKDNEAGHPHTPEQQAQRIDSTLERMRVIASAMEAQEWKRETVELIDFSDWERGLDARSRDTESETHGRLTHRIENAFTLDNEPTDHDEHTFGQTLADEHAKLGGSHSSIAYERISLRELPPRIPAGLDRAEEERLRFEIIPRLDRQLESGAHPASIIRNLNRERQNEERLAREQKVGQAFASGSVSGGAEQPLTRDEELRALYTLHTLLAHHAATEKSKAELNIGDRDSHARQATRFASHDARTVTLISERKPTERERAAAIDAIGSRLAGDFRADLGRLKSYESLESERDRIQENAAIFRSRVLTSDEFQQSLAAARRDAREGEITAREALIRGNNARLTAALPEDTKRHSQAPHYPELTGESRPLSAYAVQREANEKTRLTTRAELAGSLINPEIQQARDTNAAQLEKARTYFSRVAGGEISSSGEARLALAPQLRVTRSLLDRLHAERSAIPIETPRLPQTTPNRIYVGLPGTSPHARLPVGSFNEYQTIRIAAEKAEIPLRIYERRNDKEITGHDENRNPIFEFARDYISFRRQTDVTRQRNENRLFREFGARLDAAQSFTQLRSTINDIRRENFVRFKHPEAFREEAREARVRGEQLRRPLTENEIRTLLLAPAPTHYTDEMRALRMSHADTARERQIRIKNLASGELAPSPALETLLREFARTDSPDPERHSRNIKLFLADYLNAPVPGKTRFSPVNLHDLQQKLSPAERDFLFRTITETKQQLTSGELNKDIDSRHMRTAHAGQARDARTLNEAISNKDIIEQNTRTNQTLSVTRDSSSPSFRLYYGAVAWREAELIAAHSQDNNRSTARSDNRTPIISGVSNRDLETAVTLLTEFRSKPAMIEAAAARLSDSPDASSRKTAEIITAFHDTRLLQAEDGKPSRFSIAAPANSELSRDEWDKLLDTLPTLLSEDKSSQSLVPTAHRNAIKRQAVRLAWEDVKPHEFQQPDAAFDKHPVLASHVVSAREELERSQSLQKRARLGADVLEDHLNNLAAKASKAIERNNISMAYDSQAVSHLTRLALDSHSDGLRAPVRKPDAKDVTQSVPNDLKPQITIISHALTIQDREQHRMLGEYAARTKREYVENFRNLDEKFASLERTVQQTRGVERLGVVTHTRGFDELRDDMEKRIAGYLTAVIREHGETALLPNRQSVHHTSAVTRIIKDTLNQHGRNVTVFQLNDKHVEAAVAQLVYELPSAIGERRAKSFADNREHQLGEIPPRDSLLHANENFELARETSSPERPDAAARLLRDPDDEIVEQRVSHTLGRMQEQTSSRIPQPDRKHQHAAVRHTAQEIAADNHDQHTRLYVLTR